MKKEITIYRVVNEFNKGYKANCKDYESLDSYFNNWTENSLIYVCKGNEYEKRRPLPENDGINKNHIRSYHLFAFENIKQINSWFTKAELVLGAILGAKIQIIKIKENYIKRGFNQIIFDKRKVISIEYKSLDYFLDKKDINNEYDFKECYIECTGDDFNFEPPARLKEEAIKRKWI